MTIRLANNFTIRLYLSLKNLKKQFVTFWNRMRLPDLSKKIQKLDYELLNLLQISYKKNFLNRIVVFGSTFNNLKQMITELQILAFLKKSLGIIAKNWFVWSYQ